MVRRFEPADLDATVRLWHRTWAATFPTLAHPWPFDVWRERFVSDLLATTSVWVVEIEDQIVGFMALAVERGHLAQMFVDPDWQGRGIGTALMTLAKGTSPGGLTLHTLVRNLPARAFYERHGFVAGREGVNDVNGQPNVEYRWSPER